VFDNLNLMSLRIIGLINSVAEGKSIEIGSEYTDGELCISMPNGRRVQCEFVPFNRVDEYNVHEGWKFEIPPFTEIGMVPQEISVEDISKIIADVEAEEPYEVIPLTPEVQKRYRYDCDSYFKYLEDERPTGRVVMTFEEKYGYYARLSGSGNELRRKVVRPKILIPSPPEFVWMGGKTALRLVDSNEYYRDAGMWSVGFEQRGTEFYSVCKQMEQLNGKLLTPCTEDEYKEDNKGYTE